MLHPTVPHHTVPNPNQVKYAYELQDQVLQREYEYDTAPKQGAASKGTGFGFSGKVNAFQFYLSKL